MKKILLTILLLPPFQTYAIDNPFKSDHRVDGVIALGIVLAASGIYMMHKEQPKSNAENFLDGIVASSSLLGGIGMILYAEDIVKAFDKANE